jgi:hypothetical protein
MEFPSMVRSIQVLVILLLTLASVAEAQTPVTPCSTVAIDGPSDVDANAPVVFKAKITGMTPTTMPVFNWSVSAGTIMKGQGTDEIMVDTVGLGGNEIIATVELSGAPPDCRGSSSRPTQVKAPAIACGLAFDQYGDLRFEDEKARLDNFAIQLLNVPSAAGQILMTAGQETFKNESADRLARAKSYLANVRHIDPNRIVTTDCGFTEELRILLYTVPTGISPPSCDMLTTVPFSEVKFTKPRPKHSKKRH